MSKLISCDYDDCDTVKYHQNMNFEQMNTEPLIEENDGF